MQFDQYVKDLTHTGLEQMTAVQEQILDTNRTVAASVAKMVPATPIAGLPIAGLPDVSTVLDSSFEMAQTMLSSNRKFLTELANIWAAPTS